LESDLGAALVVFTGRHLELTETGNRFLVFAEQTLSGYRRIHDELPPRPSPANPRIRVVALPTLSGHALPAVVRDFVAKYPKANVIIDGRRIGEAIAAMVSQQADVAVLFERHTSFAQDVFQIVPLTSVRPVVALPKGSDAGALSIDEVLTRPLSAPAPPNVNRVFLDQWARDRGINLDIRYEHTLYEGMVNDVLAVGCPAVISSSMLYGAHADYLDVLEFPEGEGRLNDIVAVHAAGSSSLARDFVEFMRGWFSDGGHTHP
jgi:DNA-binding transcriptional LysR family regulator